MTSRRYVLALVILVTVFATGVANADPLLQIYIQGATYDTTTATWVLNTTSGSSFTLWTIGNISGPGGKGTIYDAKLTVAYDHLSASSADQPVFQLTPTTTGGFGGYTDPSTPGTPTLSYTSLSGTEIPTLSDGSALPSHGEYGSSTNWQLFQLGNFSNPDSPCGDFTNSGGTAIPTPSSSTGCEINAYTLTLLSTAGLPYTSLHFDLFDHVQSANKARSVFAPFSHDGEADYTSPVPEPQSLLLFGSGLLAIGGLVRRRLGL